MSLITDKIFYAALSADTQGIVATTGGRIYSTAIPVPDEQLDNEPLPYIIITFDGLQNDDTTKDNSYEGDDDKVQIGIEIVCEDRESLGSLAQAVRTQIKTYFENYEAPVSGPDLSNLIPDDYQFSAGPIAYDPWKPCYYQQLTYACDTKV